MKKKYLPNTRKAKVFIALGFMYLCIALMNCSCAKKVHTAETRAIPKVLVLTSNINDVAPELSISIITEFESLPTCWYCRHYGSGIGTTPWYLEDSAIAINKNGPTFVPLICKHETFCPYIIKGVYISLILKNEIMIYVDPQNNIDKNKILECHDTVSLLCEQTDARKRFSKSMKKAIYFAIPENIGDSLFLDLKLNFQ